MDSGVVLDTAAAETAAQAAEAAAAADAAAAASSLSHEAAGMSLSMDAAAAAAVAAAEEEEAAEQSAAAAKAAAEKMAAEQDDKAASGAAPAAAAAGNGVGNGAASVVDAPASFAAAAGAGAGASAAAGVVVVQDYAQWPTYAEGQKIAMTLKLGSAAQWKKWVKDTQGQDESVRKGLPPNPQEIYKGRGWKRCVSESGLCENRKGVLRVQWSPLTLAADLQISLPLYPSAPHHSQLHRMVRGEKAPARHAQEMEVL